MDDLEAMEFLLDKVKATKGNNRFFDAMRRGNRLSGLGDRCGDERCGDSLAFVDLETTGATATADRITEIGIVAVDADGRIEEWQQLVNPARASRPSSSSSPGISDALVADAPPSPPWPRRCCEDWQAAFRRP